jgi:hypothetical protein
MKFTYDSEKAPHERVVIEGVDAIVGCFDFKLELSDKGKPIQELHVHRWGKASERNKTHLAVYNSIKDKGEA